VTKTAVAIVGAGPYGLSLAAHLAARGVEHRIFGQTMAFWSQIAAAGGQRYLKSYCFGTNISTPVPGFSFADYSAPLGLETFEPCSIGDFTAYGHWFQKCNVGWVESVDVALIARKGDCFELALADGARLTAARVVIATGLACFAQTPPALACLPSDLVTHTSKVVKFADFNGRDVAVIGAGQSALEAAALLYEAGARPQLLVRDAKILWHQCVARNRSLWRRLRSPLSGLGSGPTGWALTRFPGAVFRLPEVWRTRFVKGHLPAEGAWWLRERVENRVPVRFGTTVVDASEMAGRAALRVKVDHDGTEHRLVVDHVIAGSGYLIDVGRLDFLDPELRGAIQQHERAPRLSAVFEASVSGLHFIGPTSAMSFGPLFRFVVGAEYAARTVSAHLSTHAKSAT